MRIAVARSSVWLVVYAAAMFAGCGDAASLDRTAQSDDAPRPRMTTTAARSSEVSPAAQRGGASTANSSQAAAGTPAAKRGGSSAGAPATSSSQAVPRDDPAADSGIEATNASSLPELCSGCSEERRDATDMTVHLHHVHLNVQNREASLQFYEKHLKAKRILLNGTTEALQTTPTLLLLDEQSAPNSNLPTALQHMGWGTEDTAAWYEAAHAQGLTPDTRGFTLFNTNESPTVGEPGSGAIIALSGAVPACFPVPDVASYMYVLGPDQERIEVWSGAEGRVNHVHFTTADLAATSGWFQQFLGLPSAVPLLSYQFFLDDILFFFEPIGAAADYEKTDDHTLEHVAFAVASLGAWRARVTDLQIEVVAEPAAAHGFNSFFVRGPDGLLIELVEAAKNPELCPP